MGEFEVLAVAEESGQHDRRTEVSVVPLGVPHESTAASLAGVQGGTGRMIAPAAPVA
ncbi:hypothetical protein [Streptomyces longispororuber]|uniref:hypothetical protein n=1 Tax=Streptomyces longispororuber TaxID=68230 RepID=UPI00210CD123|nr:hypothetical protein [Streptomyces longispororuber]MCQ4206440.1 hypothetical protein [Streptomyces longispororuber]